MKFMYYVLHSVINGTLGTHLSAVFTVIYYINYKILSEREKNNIQSKD